MSTKVSIITPTYQGAETLARAIRSVQHQSFQDWEMLIVDDGSTDHTSALVEQFCDEDNRIHYFYQENQGPAAARNLGAENAKSDYLAFLDADDVWEAHKLQGQVDLLDAHQEIALVLCDSVNISLVDGTEVNYSIQHQHTLSQLPKEFLSADIFVFSGAQLRRSLYAANFVNTSTVMIRKTCFEQAGRFNPVCKGTEDLYLWITLAASERFAYWHKICALRYKSAESVSSRSEKWLKELIRFHRMILDSQQHQDLHDIAQAQLKAVYRSLARFYGRAFAPRKALGTFNQSRACGFDMATFIFALAAFTGPGLFMLGGQISRLRSYLRKVA